MRVLPGKWRAPLCVLHVAIAAGYRTSAGRPLGGLRFAAVAQLAETSAFAHPAACHPCLTRRNVLQRAHVRQSALGSARPARTAARHLCSASSGVGDAPSAFAAVREISIDSLRALEEGEMLEAARRALERALAAATAEEGDVLAASAEQAKLGADAAAQAAGTAGGEAAAAAAAAADAVLGQDALVRLRLLLAFAQLRLGDSFAAEDQLALLLGIGIAPAGGGGMTAAAGEDEEADDEGEEGTGVRLAPELGEAAASLPPWVLQEAQFLLGVVYQVGRASLALGPAPVTPCHAKYCPPCASRSRLTPPPIRRAPRLLLARPRGHPSRPPAPRPPPHRHLRTPSAHSRPAARQRTAREEYALDLLEAVAAADETHWRSRFHLALIAAQWGMHDDAAELLLQVRAAARQRDAHQRNGAARTSRDPSRARSAGCSPAAVAHSCCPLPFPSWPVLRSSRARLGR